VIVAEVEQISSPAGRPRETPILGVFPSGKLSAFVARSEIMPELPALIWI